MDSNLTWLVTNLIAAPLLPPFSLILLIGVGLFWRARRPRLAKSLLALGTCLLYALSTPLVAGSLLNLLQPPPLPTDTDLSGVGAIVVLGAGRYEDAPEYAGDTTSTLGLERLRYAAHLHKKTGLPILATGGSPEGRMPESQFMKAILENEFGVPVRWTEGRSNNTAENARLSREILSKEKIERILLVSHAWHLARAQPAFERAGFKVVPAGTRFHAPDGSRILDYIPDAGALRSSAYAFHEIIGIIWYRLRS